MIIPNIYIYICVYIYSIYKVIVQPCSSQHQPAYDITRLVPWWSDGYSSNSWVASPILGISKKKWGILSHHRFQDDFICDSATSSVPGTPHDLGHLHLVGQDLPEKSWQLEVGEKTTEDSPVSKRCDAMATCANPKHTSTTKLHISSYINHINET